MKIKKPCTLIILDGWGIHPAGNANAVTLGKTPFLDRLRREYPATQLVCSGEAVGLPAGIMGNSEVGHLNLGAGRIVYQDLLRIDNAIKDRSFFENDALTTVMTDVASENATLHLMGLVSDGGVHSQLTHLFSLLDMAKAKGLENVCVHAILDGRDTPPKSGAGFVQELQNYIDAKGCGKIATVCGRYYAMDRDTRWERTQQAFDLYTDGVGRKATAAAAAVKNAYANDETDEFVKPITLVDAQDRPVGIIKENDGVIFFNFRADRARQITRAFTENDFTYFERKSLPKLCGYVCMTMYDETFTLPVAFPPFHLNDILGEVVSREGLAQLRIAETEKYAHVTYFFNGGEEHPFPKEDRCLVPSPRDIPTYDYKPEMSAETVATEVVSRLNSDEHNYAMIIINFANMDMVGHTGKLDAAIKAVETVDTCVERVVSTVIEKGGAALVTADHGNAEEMADADGNPHTAHTLNVVPLILVDETRKDVRLKDGSLRDVAPTMLSIMGINKPKEMTGESLIEPEQ